MQRRICKIVRTTIETNAVNAELHSTWLVYTHKCWLDRFLASDQYCMSACRPSNLSSRTKREQGLELQLGKLSIPANYNCVYGLLFLYLSIIYESYHDKAPWFASMLAEQASPINSSQHTSWASWRVFGPNPITHWPFGTEMMQTSGEFSPNGPSGIVGKSTYGSHYIERVSMYI